MSIFNNNESQINDIEFVGWQEDISGNNHIYFTKVDTL